VESESPDFIGDGREIAKRLRSLHIREGLTREQYRQALGCLAGFRQALDRFKKQHRAVALGCVDIEHGFHLGLLGRAPEYVRFPIPHIKDH
jgi:hypothetical protein